MLGMSVELTVELPGEDLKLIDLVAEFLQTALEPEEHRKSLAALILLRKVAKAILITVLNVQILEILGFHVTTAIAALGVLPHTFGARAHGRAS